MGNERSNRMVHLGRSLLGHFGEGNEDISTTKMAPEQLDDFFFFGIY